MSESLDPQGRPVSKKQAASRGMDDGWTVTGTMITGIGFWGFVGWGLWKWTDWIGFFPIGVILGAVLGVYLVIKQADAPPPLLDISKKQDGGIAARHARRVAEQKAAAKDGKRNAAISGEAPPAPKDDDRTGQPGEDEGHTETSK